MAILDNVEVRVVLKDTKEVLKEYNKPDSAPADKPHRVEKYIEAKIGQDFQVEVFFKKDFHCGPGWGIGVGIDIDGGVVSYRHNWNHAEIKRFKVLGAADVFDNVVSEKGSQRSCISFRFGTLNINEDIDITREDLDGQAARLGTIHIYVQNVDRKFLSTPQPQPSFYNPRATTDVAKELVKDKHVGSAMHGPSPEASSPSEERQPSATAVEDTHQLQIPSAVGAIKTEPMEPSVNANDTAPPNPVSSSSNDEIVRKIAQLEQHLKEAQQSQERTAAMMQGFMGGFGSMMQAFAASTPPSQAAASKLQLPATKSELAIKRGRVKEEEITDNGECSGGSKQRSTKRSKTVIELD
ncbi:MAG: hypothetical protein Q9209_003165 [Squamulea sp. 1 TL-2023]